VHDADQAERAALRVGQRIGRITLYTELRQHVVAREQLANVARIKAELLTDDVGAGSTGDVVLDVVGDLSMGVQREGAQTFGIVRTRQDDIGVVDAEGIGAVTHQRREDVAARTGDTKRRLAQHLLGAFARGNIGRDAAHGVGVAAGIAQRKLERDIGVHAVVLRHLFLEFDRRVALENRGVVATQFADDCLRKELRIGMADDVGFAPGEQFQEPPVGEQVAPVAILDVHHRGGMVEDLLQDEETVRIVRYGLGRGCHASSSVMSATVGLIDSLPA
jgi:hypothetical protein